MKTISSSSRLSRASGGTPDIGKRFALGMLVVLLSFAASQIMLAQQTGNPYPQDGDTNGVSPTVTLTWTTGSEAAVTDGNDVYVGTNATAVLNATHTSPEWKGTETSASYSCSGLTAGTTYYWRVDALNPNLAPNVWLGQAEEEKGSVLDIEIKTERATLPSWPAS